MIISPHKMGKFKSEKFEKLSIEIQVLLEEEIIFKKERHERTFNK